MKYSLVTDRRTDGQRSQIGFRFTIRNPNNSNNILIPNKRNSLNILMYCHLFFSLVTIVIHFTIIFIHIAGVC